MNNHPDNPAIARLTLSRAEILSHMHNTGDGGGTPYSFTAQTAGVGKDMLQQGLQTWWRNHPARFATDLISSQIKQFAKNHPFELLGIAAGVGAAAAVVKPSRWVSTSVGALAFAKSFDLTELVSSILDTRPAGQSSSDVASVKK